MGAPADIPRLPARKPGTHKGTVGKVHVVAGSGQFQGAGALAAMGALRAGAGLVFFSFPRSLYSAYAARLWEVILRPQPETDDAAISSSALEDVLAFSKGLQSAAVGPGFSQNPSAGKLARELYRKLEVPAVFDADALNALSLGGADLSDHAAPRVLTPHPGEFARFRKHLELPEDDHEAAASICRANNVTLVYKSHEPVVFGADRVQKVTSGSSALATGGTGDVLTGIISAFLARMEPWEAAVTGTYVHGRCGTLAGEELTKECVIASDLFKYMPQAMREVIEQD
ncbi:MAG: NAD(P)H-hydrate dehydratase [Planctomycetota bacterium]|nr:NAD(P)H-hydrate dehydratase [Planctomycetota bacterium]